MKNVFVSTKEGISLCIEDREVSWYFTGRSMSNVDVAKKTGTTRSNVGQTLRRGIKKVYYCLRKINRNLDPFEIAVIMTEILGVSSDCNEEVEKFFNLFPLPVQREIKYYASKHIQ